MAESTAPARLCCPNPARSADAAASSMTAAGAGHLAAGPAPQRDIGAHGALLHRQRGAGPVRRPAAARPGLILVSCVRAQSQSRRTRTPKGPKPFACSAWPSSAVNWRGHRTHRRAAGPGPAVDGPRPGRRGGRAVAGVVRPCPHL